MNILITNDDGIDSPGIYSLVKEFIKEGNIYVSAPDRQRSACSHSITMHNTISAKKYDFYGLDCTAYAVSGTPVDCVKLACEKLIDVDIDVVLSGINDGGNLGTDVIYSGTVSAAIEGAMLNIPSIAVSLSGSGTDRDYSTSAEFAYKIYKSFIRENFIKGIVLNVNVPSCKREMIGGVIGTSLGIRKYSNNYQEKTDDQGNILYYLEGDIEVTENGKTTDIYAVDNNYISVTPMKLEFTKFEYIDIINSWF